MATYEQRLLDDLEDARERVKHYRRGLWGFPALTALSVSFIVVGAIAGNWGTWNRVDTGGIAIALIVTGVIGVIIFGVATAWWVSTIGGTVADAYHKRKPSEVLRKAERAYRDHFMEQ